MLSVHWKMQAAPFRLPRGGIYRVAVREGQKSSPSSVRGSRVEFAGAKEYSRRHTCKELAGHDDPRQGLAGAGGIRAMVLRHQCLLLGRNSALALLLLLIAGCGDPTATSPAPEPTPDTANFDCERLDCDDGVVCTLDSCSAEVGCEHAPRDADCDDGVSCTDDSCDVEEGCVFAPQVGLCDDGKIGRASCRERV